ncbi:hypothetical protein SPONL_561 [uncultured Candidatus Thioglobus sp.]|nr:hypothetical protein SPONL_561 [uncultured Candidatus Thioglobus sp.]
MYNLKTIISISLISILLSGCAAMGVHSTNDPDQKINDAYMLFDEQQRPLPAERLIREAITIYKANNNMLGLAEAYRAYGFFFRSGVIGGKYHKHYKERGFMEKNATYTNRYEKSIEYFKKSAEIYKQNSALDKLTNIYLNMGFTYEFAGLPNKACKEYKRSIVVSQTFARQNPNIKLILPKGYDTHKEYMKPFLDRLICK